LVQQLLTASDDAVAADLAKEIWRGFPVVGILPLLHGGDVAAGAGAWVLSEIAELADPLLSELPALLQHPARNARFFALDFALARGPADPTIMAPALRLLRDHEAAVRWKAMMFVSRASLDQLRAGSPGRRDPELTEQLNWLLGLEQAADAPTQITEHLFFPTPLARVVAAAAAARRAEVDPTPLEAAANSGDPEVATFAADFRELLRS
jgi:hypothetical protein